VLDNILGPVKAVSATAATHIPKRWVIWGHNTDFPLTPLRR
jgi:hypothetical protein